MDIRKSELQQTFFAVIDSSIAIEIPTASVEQERNDLDIDLDMFINKEDRHMVRVQFTIRALRTHNDRIGLKIDVLSTTDFHVDESLDPECETFLQLVQYSATAIAYNNIRAYLHNATSYYPADPYILPTIDLNDLVKKFAEKQKPQEEE